MFDSIISELVLLVQASEHITPSQLATIQSNIVCIQSGSITLCQALTLLQEIAAFIHCPGVCCYAS